MSRRRVAVGVVVLLLAGAAAGAWWRFGQARAAGSGRSAELSASWYGSFHGAMSLPATLYWCPVSRTGLLEAIAGDSGIAVVFFERDGLTSGSHTVVAAAIGPTAPRPVATVALRWLRVADTAMSLVAMESVGGVARLTVTNGIAAGDLSVRTRSMNAKDTLVVRGSFRGVRVVTAAAGCT